MRASRSEFDWWPLWTDEQSRRVATPPHCKARRPRRFAMVTTCLTCGPTHRCMERTPADSSSSSSGLAHSAALSRDAEGVRRPQGPPSKRERVSTQCLLITVCVCGAASPKPYHCGSAWRPRCGGKQTTPGCSSDCRRLRTPGTGASGTAVRPRLPAS